MDEWLKGRVNALGDNGLWAAIVHWWPTMLVTLGAVFSAWLHLGIATRFLIALPLVAVSCQALVDRGSKRSDTTVPLITLGAPIQDMQIELIEHGEFSSELLLECVNHGGPVTLTASLRVIGASPGLAYKGVGYQGTWVKPVSLAHNRVGVEYASKPSASVATGDSANLRIATIDAPQKPEGNAYMYLSGPGDRATWDLEHTAATDLPYFIVSVQIRAKDHNHVLKKTYKVGPPHRNESLRMVEYFA